MEGFKFFTDKNAAVITRTVRADGSQTDETIGVVYTGFIGGLKAEVIDCINGTLGIRSAGIMLALNKAAVEDLQLIMNGSSPSTELKFFNKIDQTYVVPGIMYRGTTGVVAVDFFLNTENKSASLTIDNQTIAIFPEMLEDIKTILKKDSMELAS